MLHVILTPGRKRQEEQGFEVILSYTKSLRLRWVTRDPVGAERGEKKGEREHMNAD